MTKNVITGAFRPKIFNFLVGWNVGKKKRNEKKKTSAFLRSLFYDYSLEDVLFFIIMIFFINNMMLGRS